MGLETRFLPAHPFVETVTILVGLTRNANKARPKPVLLHNESVSRVVWERYVCAARCTTGRTKSLAVSLASAPTRQGFNLLNAHSEGMSGP